MELEKEAQRILALQQGGAVRDRRCQAAEELEKANFGWDAPLRSLCVRVVVTRGAFGSPGLSLEVLAGLCCRVFPVSVRLLG